MKTINEILPIAGWSAYAVECTKNTLSIKYKFEDVSYLLCPKTRKATLSPHQSYYLRIRDLPVGEKQTILEIEVVECWCYECNIPLPVITHHLYPVMTLRYKPDILLLAIKAPDLILIQIPGREPYFILFKAHYLFYN